jgi:hypothetical protein
MNQIWNLRRRQNNMNINTYDRVVGMKGAMNTTKVPIERIIKSNLDIIVDMAGTSSIEEAWDVFTNNPDLADEIRDDFGYDWQIIKEIVEREGYTFTIADKRRYKYRE